MYDQIVVPPDPVLSMDAGRLERRGRWWVFGSFLLCPCHLPLTLGVLVAVLGGTGVGAVLRDNLVLAGGLVTVTWLAGTAYGFHLLRRSQREGGCRSATGAPPDVVTSSDGR